MEDPSPKKWYAVYTRAKCEKMVRDNLSEICSAYLPLQHVRRRWSDRFKKLTVPLLPSYVFIYMRKETRFEVYKDHNVVSILGRNGGISPIPDRDMDVLRTMETSRLPFELTRHNYQFSIGDRVRFTSGPLTGLEGEVEKLFNQSKVYIHIPSLRVCFTTQVSAIAPDYSAGRFAEAYA